MNLPSNTGKMKLIRGTFVFALLLAAFYGCRPDPVFPAEPSLTFKEYIDHPNSDSLEVVFSFTDGDGDIGVSLTDTDTNMVLTLYNWVAASQNYQTVDDPQFPNPADSIMYKYRIPKLTAGQTGLEGDIYVTITKTSLIATGNDTIQFNAFLLDQSRHKSSVIRTPELILHP